MGLERLGTSFAQRTSGYLKSAGKTSILQTKPINSTELKGLKYTAEPKTDTFVRKVESWYDSADHVRPYCEEGKTMVEGHHNFHAINSSYNETLESRLKDIESIKDKNPKFYDFLITQFDEQTKNLLETNVKFTKLTPQPRDCVAYRGTCRRIGEARQDFDVIDSAKIGDIITPTRGFAYGAHRKFGTFPYLGSPFDYKGNLTFEPMLIEYRIPKGAKVSSNMEHGGEVVFPGLSKYKLLSKETRLIEKLDYQSGNAVGSYPYKHVVLEYIPEIPT